MTPKFLDIKTISVWDNYGFEYAACFGDYDEGVKTGTGKTEEEAIMDLVDYYRDFD